MTFNTRAVEIQPSVLEVPPDKLAQALEDTDGHVRTIHMDVMDGKFVPRDTRAVQPPQLIPTLKKHGFEASVHLMTRRPLHFARAYASAGAAEVIFHVEATTQPLAIIHALRREFPRVRVGVSLNPRTSVARVTPLLPFVDFVLVMTVQPGNGGQPFKAACLSKVRAIKTYARKLGGRARAVRVGVDGGAKVHTVPQIVRAGADAFVAGSAVYNDRGTPGENVLNLQHAIKNT